MNRAMRRGQTFEIKMLGGQYATQMSCQEAVCEANAKGWFMALDVAGNPDHATFATWVKQKSGRRFYEWLAPYALDEALSREALGDLVVAPELRVMLESLPDGFLVFCFPPGQTCFKQHLDREVVFAHDKYIHANGRDFNEDMNESADRAGVLRQRG